MDANGNSMLRLGKISVTFKLGKSHIRTSFYVLETLSVPVILRCVSIRCHVKATHPIDDNIELEEENLIPLVKSSSGASPAMQIPTKRNVRGKIKPLAPKGCSKKTRGEIRASETRFLEPRQRVTVLVNSQASALFCLLPNQRLSRTLGLAMTNGIADVRKNRPFRVYVAHFRRNTRWTPKPITIGYAKQVHGCLKEQPSVLALLHTDQQTKLDSERFHRKPPDTLSERISTKEFREDPRKWEMSQDENLKDLSDKSMKVDILEVLRKHHEIWKGHLGEIKATWHKIDSDAGTRPIRRAPYRAGREARELITAEIDRMIAREVIEPSLS